MPPAILGLVPFPVKLTEYPYLTQWLHTMNKQGLIIPKASVRQLPVPTHPLAVVQADPQQTGLGPHARLAMEGLQDLPSSLFPLAFPFLTALKTTPRLWDIVWIFRGRLQRGGGHSCPLLPLA